MLERDSRHTMQGPREGPRARERDLRSAPPPHTPPNTILPRKPPAAPLARAHIRRNPPLLSPTCQRLGLLSLLQGSIASGISALPQPCPRLAGEAAGTRPDWLQRRQLRSPHACRAFVAESPSRSLRSDPSSFALGGLRRSRFPSMSPGGLPFDIPVRRKS